MTARETLIFLTFGRVSDVSSALAEEGLLVAEKGGGLGRQVALIGQETGAFRLNTRGWLAVPAELASAMDSRAILRTLCRDRLVAASPPFAAMGKRAVEAYLDRIGELAGPPAEQLRDITHPSDRFFAALLPMSNAHILPVTMEANRPVPVSGLEPVRTDLAFWDGKVLSAFLFGGRSARLPRQMRALTALKDTLGARVRILDLDPMDDFDACLLPKGIYAAMTKAKPPYFGPYRAIEFAMGLPENG